MWVFILFGPANATRMQGSASVAGPTSRLSAPACCERNLWEEAFGRMNIDWIVLVLNSPPRRGNLWVFGERLTRLLGEKPPKLPAGGLERDEQTAPTVQIYKPAVLTVHACSMLLPDRRLRAVAAPIGCASAPAGCCRPQTRLSRYDVKPCFAMARGTSIRELGITGADSSAPSSSAFTMLRPP
jgi:hypothetical protein